MFCFLCQLVMFVSTPRSLCSTASISVQTDPRRLKWAMRSAPTRAKYTRASSMHFLFTDIVT